jgi:hypothetical protein
LQALKCGRVPPRNAIIGFFGITDFIMAGYGFRLCSSSEVESLTALRANAPSK